MQRAIRMPYVEASREAVRCGQPRDTARSDVKRWGRGESGRWEGKETWPRLG